MALSKIWVFAEAADGKRRPPPRSSCSPRPASSPAPSRPSRRRRRRRGRRPRSASTAPPRCYATGDLGGALPGVAVAGRHRRPRSTAATPPTLILFATELRRPRRRRPPVGQARPHGAHQQRRPRRSTATARHVPTPVFGGTTLVKTDVHRRRPAPRRDPPEVVRGRAGAAAARPRSSALAVPDPGATGGATVTDRHVEETHGPEARRGRRRGLRWPWPRRGRQVRDGRGAGQAAQGCARRVPCHRRRRLGALQLPGRPDRQGREADASTSPPASRAPPSTWWA